MKKLITGKRWKDQIGRRQKSDLRRRNRTKPGYSAPRAKEFFATIKVPSVFSIILNPDEMNTFFAKLRVYAKKSHVALDLTDVEQITNEAIATLAATMSELEDTTVKGNFPADQTVKQALVDSGFFEHVRGPSSLQKGKVGKMKKHQSELVEATTARELIEVGTEQAFGKKGESTATRAAYTALIELMSNTHNHAKGKRANLEMWWAAVYGDANRKRVCYSFLDTGVGIFRSVRMTLVRRLLLPLGIRTDPELLCEILQGNVASSTALPYRGKGLPTIYKKSESGDLKSLFIIANDVFADVTKGVYRSLEVPFKGTLLYWECEE